MTLEAKEYEFDNIIEDVKKVILIFVRISLTFSDTFTCFIKPQ